MTTSMAHKTDQYRTVGKFELHELIGEGAMGAVWKAYDSVIRRYVALKILSGAVGRSPDARDRFLREARAAGALQHPNLITIYDLGEADGQLFIAMELVDGRDLSTLVAMHEPLALERKLDIAIEVLQGLAYAHERGVIHRDVKPSNVRIASDGAVKIMDFGIARLQWADVTGSGSIVGTPTYMAPEQITNGPITPATDLFAVGCLLYELLSYRKPFEGETVHGVLYQVLTTDPKPLRTMAPSIPAALERVVAKALNKIPEDRYETARQMQSALFGIRAALSGASDATARMTLRWTPIPGAALRLVTRAPLKWRLAALAALGIVVTMLYYVARQPSSAAAPPPPDEGGLTTVALNQVVAAPLPGGLNPALVAQRDSALAARDRAQRAGAMKNNVPSLLLAETMLHAAEHAVRSGDLAHAATGYLSAVAQYRTALGEAEALRQEAEHAIGRATPVVRALATRPEAGRAATSLQRAESLHDAMDFTLAKLAALDAEQVGVAAGVAPASPQPLEARAAIEVLLEDLARAMASERVANVRVLYPGMTDAERTSWEAFFRSATGLTARYTVKSLSVSGNEATAVVDAVYGFAPAGGGAQREERPHFSMRFANTPNGWRLTTVSEVR
ncbi:MAG TPA: serine/threonine-protein kinase [Gemmatimonadales bacterium]|nr:serine/threonine-protein kinase [Gemmatimonadales bacterium]HYT84155.1 serine/threonine-protein kinase [Gemmatimonadales bacterium]